MPARFADLDLGSRGQGIGASRGHFATYLVDDEHALDLGLVELRLATIDQREITCPRFMNVQNSRTSKSVRPPK